MSLRRRLLREREKLTPSKLTSSSRHQNTETVEENIVPMVLPQNMYLAAIFPKREAIEKEQYLDA